MATTTPQEGRSAARSSLVVPALTLILAVAALWRVRQGLDLTGDGAHMVSLAVRMAQGDVPFRDEMNVQALGSVTAVPFTWVWLQLHGTEGIVLASRIWYLVVAFTFGALCYRALRTGLPPVPAFVGVVLALTPTPYNLLVTSYNTMPTLALGMAVFSGYAALLTRSGRWGAVCGAALTFATLSHPASLPGAAVLGVIVLMLGLRRGVTRGLLAGGLGVSAVVVAWVLLVPGPSAVLHTLTYTTAYQSERPTPVARLAEITDRFGTALWAWGMVPVALLVILALVPAVPARWRAAALLAVWPVMALAVVIGNAGEPKKVWVGVICAAWAVMVVLVLVLPVSLAVLRTVKELRLLLLLSLPLAVVGGATYGLTTSADAQWGPTMPPMAALLVSSAWPWCCSSGAPGAARVQRCSPLPCWSLHWVWCTCSAASATRHRGRPTPRCRPVPTPGCAPPAIELNACASGSRS